MGGCLGALGGQSLEALGSGVCGIGVWGFGELWAGEFGVRSGGCPSSDFWAAGMLIPWTLKYSFPYFSSPGTRFLKITRRGAGRRRKDSRSPPFGGLRQLRGAVLIKQRIPLPRAPPILADVCVPCIPGRSA